MVLEIEMADFIMERVARADFKELKEIVANEPAVSENFKFQIKHEIQFYDKLYEITGNNTIKKFQKMLLSVFDYVHNSWLLKKN